MVADGVLLEYYDVTANESSLTGEAEEITKSKCPRPPSLPPSLPSSIPPPHFPSGRNRHTSLSFGPPRKTPLPTNIHLSFPPSLPPPSDEDDPFLLSGCQVTGGNGQMLALAVGKESRWGRIREKLEAETKDTPLQVRPSLPPSLPPSFHSSLVLPTFLSSLPSSSPFS